MYESWIFQLRRKSKCTFNVDFFCGNNTDLKNWSKFKCNNVKLVILKMKSSLYLYMNILN